MLVEVEVEPNTGQSLIKEVPQDNVRFTLEGLSKKKISPAAVACMLITGDSMEPMLTHGSLVGIDRSRSATKDGELFAVSKSGKLRVREIHRTQRGMRMVSFNKSRFPDEEFSWQEMHDLQIAILGRVFWWSVWI
nr:S24 family peptidase [Pseudomonas typographi]